MYGSHYTFDMRVLMLSKALVVGAYQRKLELLAAEGLDLHVVVPPRWAGQPLEREHTSGYALHVTPIVLDGNFHLHAYPFLGGLVTRLRPDLVHIDEEPYNLATWLAWRAARGVGAKTLFFSWQNLERRYPPPFAWMEKAVLAGVDGALVGNAEAESVWRAKGFTGPIAQVPQFGVDPAIYAPAERRAPDGVLRVGYAGRFVPEKGVDTLLLALAQTPGAELRLIGAGPEQRLYEHLIVTHGLGDRVRFEAPRPSSAMPEFYNALDVLVLPSRTRPNWKEQFGRVVIEAMGCGVPAIVSDSGEPQHLIAANSISPSGLLFPEDDVEALAACLARLRDDPALRAALSTAARSRAASIYSMHGVAQRTAEFYGRVVG